MFSFFQAGDQRGEIFLPGGNTVEEDDVGVSRFQPVLHRTRQPFAILLFVVNDGDALGASPSQECILPPLAPWEESSPAVRIMC